MKLNAAAFCDFVRSLPPDEAIDLILDIRKASTDPKLRHTALAAALSISETAAPHCFGAEDFMLTDAALPGKKFRCDCGANVFRRNLVDTNIYRCNGCKAYYTAEPAGTGAEQ